MFVEGTALAETEDASGLSISALGGGVEVGFPFRQELRTPRGERSRWQPELSVRARLDYLEATTLVSGSVGVRVSSRHVEAEVFGGVTMGFGSSERLFGPSFGAAIPIVISRHLSVVPRAVIWLFCSSKAGEGCGLAPITGIGLRWQF